MSRYQPRQSQTAELVRQLAMHKKALKQTRENYASLQADYNKLERQNADKAAHRWRLAVCPEGLEDGRRVLPHPCALQGELGGRVMSTYRYLYVREDIGSESIRKGGVFVNAHYLVGYNQGTISDYRRMAREMCKDIPGIRDAQVGCHHVTKSSSCQGFSLARFDGVIDRKLVAELKRKGWTVMPNGRCDYCWS